jgi:hypothetical protein
MTEEVVERLDRITAILQLAHGDAIERARTRIRSDNVNAAILDASAKWVPSATMQATVATKTKVSTRTIQERIADLVAQGVLERRGATRTTEYRASGLI